MISEQYRSLNYEKILETLKSLDLRISRRFPDSGLRRVCEELIEVCKEAKGDLDFLRSPHRRVQRRVKAAIGLTLAAVLAIIWWVIQLPKPIDGQGEAVQVIDAAVSSAVFIGIAVIYLLKWEPRLKRERALKMVHKLRSLAHVIDMHQLTKDPERMLSAEPNASSGPERPLTPPQLGRYLDYCSDMLSVESKLAALLVQDFDDPVVLAAVDEIESLTTGLSGKIWQKIQLLDTGRITS